MPRARKRVCSEPGCPQVQAEPRCMAHRKARNAHQYRTTPTKVTLDWTERIRRHRFVDAHRARYGNVCPGFGRPPHPAADLTADHIREVSRGGSPIGPLQVLCRSCNSRKAGTRR